MRPTLLTCPPQPTRFTLCCECGPNERVVIARVRLDGERSCKPACHEFEVDETFSLLGHGEEVEQQPVVGVTCLDIALESNHRARRQHPSQKRCRLWPEALNSLRRMLGFRCVNADESNAERCLRQLQTNRVAIHDLDDHRTLHGDGLIISARCCDRQKYSERDDESAQCVSVHQHLWLVVCRAPTTTVERMVVTLPNNFGMGRVGVWTFALDIQPMARAQEAARELEELGYGCIWVPEAVGREPFASCALLLSATSRIGVATGIASMYARSAITMQAGWRTLSEAFGERFTLGIGASHEHMATKLHKGTYDKPYSAMVTYLDQMDKGIFAAAAPTTTPRRVLAALGPRMLALSAERGLGAHPYFVPPEHTKFARDVLGDGPLLAPEQAVLLETDPTKAREIARKFMATYIRLPNYANNLRRLGYSDDDLGDATRPPSDRMVDAIVAWGTIDDAVARVKAHFDAGASHVSIQVLDADPLALPMRQWRELASATKHL